MEMHWEHHEYGADGHLVARYKSYQTFDPEHRVQRSGWCKYDHEASFIIPGWGSGPLDEA